MANQKVTLLWTCKTERGWRRYPVVLNKRGQIRKGVVIIEGQEGQYPEGHFELRLYEGSKPIIKNIGPDAAEAQLAHERETNFLAARNAASAAGLDLEVRSDRKSLAQLKEEFLTVKTLEPHRSNDAGATYRIVLDEFLQVCTKLYTDQVDAVDVLRYCDGVEKRGLTERTRSNRFTALKTFLRFCGVDPKSILTREQLKKLKKFTRKEVEVYSQQELDTLIATTPKEGYRLLWEFLLKTGFRMAEAMHLEWGDIDLENNTVTVRANPHWGFTPKDSEERSVPLINGLGEKLKAWHAKNPTTRLVFGTRSDQPNNKMLPKLKRFVRLAGLNCNHCSTCKEKGECERFWLHKFRSTYATRLLQSGVDVRTVQKLLGHSDLDSTLRYLQPAKGQVVQDKVNAAFAAGG